MENCQEGMELTSINDQIQCRYQEVASRVSAIDDCTSRFFERTELMDCVSTVERLLNERAGSKENGGSESHPLGNTPHLNTKILFYLDRCEILLTALESSESSSPRDQVDPELLIYSSFHAVLLRRFYALLVHCRKYVFGPCLSYEAPSLMELLYLKCPAWMEPIFSVFISRRQLGTRRK